MEEIASASARLPADERVYAIGDVHGEASLLKRLMENIVLGDFIDRGPQSADILLALSRATSDHIVVLKGNHEACLVACYRGDKRAMDFWRKFGGGATMTSFGMSEEDIATLDSGSLIETLRGAVDRDVIEWVDALPTCWSMGGYYFAHAGIRPGVRLDHQKPDDLMWIRKPFLASGRDHGKIIVYGHTIENGTPIWGCNRIGIDTGAHEDRRLTALGLEEDWQRTLQAID